MVSKQDFLQFFEGKYKHLFEAADHPVRYNRYNGFKKIFSELLDKKSDDFHSIETGCSRYPGNFEDGQSTFLFYEFLDLTGGELISIDIDSDAIHRCATAIDEIKSDFAALYLAHGDSIPILENLRGSADLIYLDSMDLDFDDPSKSMAHHMEEFFSLRHVINESENVIIIS